MTSQIILGSLRVDGLARLAEAAITRGPVLFVPTAANGLPDRVDIAAQYHDQLVALGWSLRTADLEALDATAAARAIDGAAAVFFSGGDPYRLLAAVRRAAIGPSVRALLARGGAYIGVSAGAMIAGPTLSVVTGVSPFDAQAGADLTGLGLTDIVVLPHDDRNGRRALHSTAQRRFGARHRLLAITDDELVVGGTPWRIIDQRRAWSLRPARAVDAEAVSEVFALAGRAAWRFFGEHHLSRLTPDPDRWRDRISQHPGDDAIVVEGAGGVIGFVLVRPSPDADLGPGHGEISALYTHPRSSGRGVGRRLLTVALDRLRAGRHHTAVLWTETRNTRALAIYARQGWSLDGAVRTRTFLDTPITEVRHRLPL